MSDTKCPHCGEEITGIGRAEYNVYSYGKSLVTVTGCCGNAVRVSLIRSFRYMAVHDRHEDDWGEPVKK